MSNQPGTYDHSENISRRYFFKYKDGKSYKITIYRDLKTTLPENYTKNNCASETEETKKNPECNFEPEIICYLTWEHVQNFSSEPKPSDFIILPHAPESKIFRKNFYTFDLDSPLTFFGELFLLSQNKITNGVECTSISLNNVAFVNFDK